MAFITSSLAVRFESVTKPDQTSMDRFVESFEAFEDDVKDDVKYLDKKELSILEKKDSNMVARGDEEGRVGGF